MITYKYITADTVAKIDADGKSRLSCSIENTDFKVWLSEGNTPLPCDPPTAAELNAPILAKMAEVEHRIVCALCEKDAEYIALKAKLV